MEKTAEPTAAYVTFRDLLIALRNELVRQFDDPGIVDETVINALAGEDGQRFNEEMKPTQTAIWSGVTAFLLTREVPVSQLKPWSGEPFSPAMLANIVISEAVHAAREPIEEIRRQQVARKPRVRSCIQAAYNELVDKLFQFAALERHNPPAEEEDAANDPPQLAFGSRERALIQTAMLAGTAACSVHRAIYDSAFDRVPGALRAQARGAWVLLDERIPEEEGHTSSAALAALVARNYGAPAA